MRSYVLLQALSGDGDGDSGISSGGGGGGGGLKSLGKKWLTFAAGGGSNIPLGGARTKAMKKTLSPCWNEQLELPVNGATKLLVTVCGQVGHAHAHSVHKLSYHPAWARRYRHTW